MELALVAMDAMRERPPASVRGEVDEETIDACRRGDRVALTHFVRIYEKTVFAFLSRMVGTGPHVEDLAQEVFLRAHQALPRFHYRADVRVSTWLLKIAVRLVQDHRKKKRLPVVPLDTELVADARRGPEHMRRRREIAAAFERAAAQLSDEQRAVFLLAHFHGRSMAEIAELVGIPEATAKTRLFRARAKLRTLLAPHREASTEERVEETP